MFNYVCYVVICAAVFMSPLSGKIGEKPYITCHLRGQLGNHLHQIATTLAYAWDHNAEPIFPELNRKDLNIPMNRERIFFRLSSSPLPRPIRHTFEHRNNFEKIDIPVRPDQNLNGQFQTWKYYDHHREKIINTFAPSAQELKKIQEKHAQLLKHPLTVGVHVRTFNKKWSKLIPFVGLAYYEKAMSRFPSEALFVVFSDRINWTKHHFAKFKRSIIFIDGQDHIEDFFLMSMLKHNIIGNSSFSWWAAYLNKNPNKNVIAPSHFTRPRGRTKVNGNMPDWFVIDINYNHAIDSYPKDIYDYDIHSTSVDVDKLQV